MIVEMENYKFEVKRVIHLTAIDTITPCYFVVLYLCWNRVTSLVWCQFWLQILTKKSILAFELLKSLIKQENWYLSNKVNFLSILLLLLKKFFVVRFVSYNYQFFWKISLKFVKEIWSYCIYIKLGIFGCSQSGLCFLNMPIIKK